jgi:hypothetical protein
MHLKMMKACEIARDQGSAYRYPSAANNFSKIAENFFAEQLVRFLRNGRFGALRRIQPRQ